MIYLTGLSAVCPVSTYQRERQPRARCRKTCGRGGKQTEIFAMGCSTPKLALRQSLQHVAKTGGFTGKASCTVAPHGFILPCIGLRSVVPGAGKHAGAPRTQEHRALPARIVWCPVELP